MTNKVRSPIEMFGYAEPSFQGVADAFRKQLARSEGGAALAIYRGDVLVLDLWGGSRDDSGEPWERDTITMCNSATKGVTATAVHLLAARTHRLRHTRRQLLAGVCCQWQGVPDHTTRAKPLRRTSSHQTTHRHVAAGPRLGLHGRSPRRRTPCVFPRNRRRLSRPDLRLARGRTREASFWPVI